MSQLNITVVNADLRMSSYPLMLGHFKEDEIINSEKSINQRWNNYLEDLYDYQQYPLEIEKNHVFIDPKFNPKGIVVVGLGESRFLSAYDLSRSVESAIMHYTFKMEREHQGDEYSKYRNSISSLCIGSGYGNLSVDESLRGILIGIVNANHAIGKKGEKIQKIEKVEFVESINFKASNIYATLFKLARTHSYLELNLESGISQKHGRKRGLAHEEYKKKWHVFTTELVSSNVDGSEQNMVKMRSDSGHARIEEEEFLIDNNILKEIKAQLHWEPNKSQALFGRLIPSPFKNVLKSQLDVIWQLDKYSAEIPWELLHANSEDEKPTFVSTGLIRQLITKDYTDNSKILRSNKALIIGNPIYEDDEDLPKLIAAEKEADFVKTKLLKENFDVDPMIGETGDSNFRKLVNTDCKVLHIAAHGKYSNDGGKVGIALGSGRYFGPQDFKSKEVIPEFVFINCCYSGAINSVHEELNQKQYKMAANIGTQLIEQGAEAVIVAGWVVDDIAAKKFAECMYDELLEGYTFGEAVKKARQQCYEVNKTSITWAAFQCYGNPSYRLVKKTPKAVIQDVYILEEDVIIELQNLLSLTEDKNASSTKEIIQDLEACMLKAKISKFITSPVIELQARIYQACGKLEKALSTYIDLLEREDALYNVKSLEQYCNVYAKVLVKRYKDDPKNVTDEDKKVLKEKLDSLTLIGVTSERLSLQASGFKRLAHIEEEEERVIANLSQMKERYEEAFHRLKDIKFRKSIYPLTNWYTGIAITYCDESQKEVCIQKLKEVEDTLSSEVIEGKDFWSDISVVNILMCQMLFLDPRESNYQQSLNDYKNRVLQNYEHHWEVAGNKKHLNSEVEHLEFLIGFVKNDVLINVLKEMLRELESRCGESHLELTTS